MTKNSASVKNIHKISWPMKLALALAFLPVCWLILALAFKLPLPTLPFINLSGDSSPEYVFFLAYSTKSVSGSAIFAVFCFAIGIALFIGLAMDRGSINQAYKDLVKNLKEDLSNIFSLEVKKEAKKEPIRKVIFVRKKFKE